MRTYLLPQEGSFYKANLHSHTNLSDGELSPLELKQLYKSRGYSVLAITDHDIFIPHHDLTEDDFLLLSGFEMAFNENGTFPGNRYLKCCHICLLARSPEMREQPFWHPRYAYVGNAKMHHDQVCPDPATNMYVRNYDPEEISRVMETCREAGFFVTYNHPTWSMEDYRQYGSYHGMHAMEIFNYDCERIGYPSYVPNIYDDILRTGKKIYPVAADDSHCRKPENDPGFDAGGGFAMIKAKELNYRAVMDALFAGDFYASSGPEIYELYVEDDRIHIKTSPCARIEMTFGTRGSHIAHAKPGETVDCAEFPLDRQCGYFRLTLRDGQGNFANTRAYFMEDLL